MGQVSVEQLQLNLWFTGIVLVTSDAQITAIVLQGNYGTIQ